MAEQEPTTPVPLPVSPRALVIPYVLTPAELDGRLRVGEALANISERLSAMMGRPGGPLAGELQDLATIKIDLLDVVEPDADLEEDGPGKDNGDAEPSLGSIGGTNILGDQTRWATGWDGDQEEEHDGREASLCGLTFGTGNDGDREGEHDGCEPDADDEASRQPIRLDVALAGEEARHA